MKDCSLAYDEKDKDLDVRIAAHKKYANIKIETLIADLLRTQSYERVCDVGCGSGNYTSLLARQAKIYVGVDINNELLNKANQASYDEEVRNAVFMRWDINDPFPFVSGSFDLVFSAFSAYYVNDASQLVAGFHDLLKPGGILYILGPAPGNAIELDQISEMVFGKSGSAKKDARLDRLKSEFLPLVEEVFSHHAIQEFDISLVFPSVQEYSAYYMATPQFKELAEERASLNLGIISEAIETISTLRLTKKVLLLGAERGQS